MHPSTTQPHEYTERGASSTTVLRLGACISAKAYFLEVEFLTFFERQVISGDDAHISLYHDLLRPKVARNHRLHCTAPATAIIELMGLL